MADVCEDYVALADKGGTEIYIMNQAGMQGREKIAPQGAIQQKAAKSPVPPVQTGKDVLRAHQLQPLFPAGKQNFPVFRRRFEKSSLFHDEMPAHQLHAVVHQTEGGG